MHYKHYELFLEYFDATIGRYYSSEQRQRLLTLLLGSKGIYRGQDENISITEAVAEVESQDINSITDSKNYKLICDILDSEEDVCLAAAALVDVYSRMNDDRDRHHGMRYLDWIISLKKANPKTDEICTEIAYFEYANGNIKKAIKELGELVNGGSIVAVHHLAYIFLEDSGYKEAYYYFSLIKGIYIKQLELTVDEYVERNIELCRTRISDADARRIDTDVEKLCVEFPLCKCKDYVTVGFMSTERRFTFNEY